MTLPGLFSSEATVMFVTGSDLDRSREGMKKGTHGRKKYGHRDSKQIVKINVSCISVHYIWILYLAMRLF